MEGGDEVGEEVDVDAQGGDAVWVDFCYGGGEGQGLLGIDVSASSLSGGEALRAERKAVRDATETG